MVCRLESTHDSIDIESTGTSSESSCWRWSNRDFNRDCSLDLERVIRIKMRIRPPVTTEFLFSLSVSRVWLRFVYESCHDWNRDTLDIRRVIDHLQKQDSLFSFFCVVSHSNFIRVTLSFTREQSISIDWTRHTEEENERNVVPMVLSRFDFNRIVCHVVTHHFSFEKWEITPSSGLRRLLSLDFRSSGTRF